jgi:hypothetical protein
MGQGSQANPPEPPAAPSGDQVEVLLTAATGLLDEDLRQREQRATGLRSELAVVGVIFAVVQAAVIALMNGVLAGKDGVSASGFFPYLTALGAVATTITALAAVLTFSTSRPRETLSLSAETLLTYAPFARAGNPAVAMNLLSAYSELVHARRDESSAQSRIERVARRAMLGAVVVLAVELIVALIAASLHDTAASRSSSIPDDRPRLVAIEPATLAISPTNTFAHGTQVTVVGRVNAMARGDVVIELSYRTGNKTVRESRQVAVRKGTFATRIATQRSPTDVSVAARYAAATVISEGAARLTAVPIR